MGDDALAEIAESNEQAAWIVQEHAEIGPGSGRGRCRICDEWWPCDLVGMAALALLNARKAGALTATAAAAEPH